MYCLRVNCKRMDDDGACTVFSEMGQLWRMKREYCPMAPVVASTKPQVKKRVGQQKQKKRK